MAKFVRNLSSALFLNRASSGVGEIPYVRAVEGRIWGIEPAPFFFTGAAFGNINHPAMLRFPFRTYRSLLVPARGDCRFSVIFSSVFSSLSRCRNSLWADSLWERKFVEGNIVEFTQ